MRKIQFFFLIKSMLGKLLEFGCMHENKIFFLKEEISLNFFRFVFEFFIFF